MLSIPREAVALLVGAAAAFAAGMLWRRRGDPSQKRRETASFFWDALAEGFLLFFLLAKLSLLLDNPTLPVSDPAGFLAKPWGLAGGFAAGIAAGGWLVFRGYRFLSRREGALRRDSAAGLGLMVLILGSVACLFGGLAVRYLPEETVAAGWRPQDLRALDLPHLDSETVPGEPGEPAWGADYLVINAWASWCPPCRAEIPELIRFYEEHRGAVELIGVNMTSTESSRQEVEAFCREEGVNYPVLLDQQGDFGRLAENPVLPTTWVFDGRGKLLTVQTGALTARWLRAQTALDGED